MGPEADPLQKQTQWTPDKQKQQQRSCNLQASRDFVQAMYLVLAFNLGVFVCCLKYAAFLMPHKCAASAEQQVTEQADHVRHLKEADGLTKGDAVLDAAIAELLKRKELLQHLQ